MSKSLTSKAITGFQWTTTSTIVTSLMQIVYTSVMSRLLAPEAFGLIAISHMFITFLTYFAKMGMGNALIQKKEISSHDIRAAFTAGLLMVSFFTGIVYVTAPLSGEFFDKVDDKVVDVIRVMSLTFFVTGTSLVSSSLLMRDLRFKLMAVIEITSYVVAYLIIGVLLGYLGYGVWSLVFASLSQSIIYSVLFYIYTRHTVRPIFQWKYHRPLFAYGSKLQLTSFVEFISGTIPTVLIGRFFGDYKLGIYRQAYMIANLPLVQFAQSIQRVLFPMFSQIQGDREKLKMSFMAIITVMASILFPVCFTMSVASEEIILVMFGDKFVESYPVLQILALGMCFKFLTPFAGIVCDATARLNAKLYIQSVNVLLLIGATFFIKDYGLLAFAIVVTANEFLINIAYMIMVKAVLKTSLREYITAYLPGIINGVIISVIVYFLTRLMNYFEFVLLVKLLIQILVGFVLLVYFTLIRPPKAIRSVLENHFLNMPFFEGRGKMVLPYLKWYSPKYE